MPGLFHAPRQFYKVIFGMLFLPPSQVQSWEAVRRPGNCRMKFLQLMQGVSEVIFVLTALINTIFWVCSGFRLPKYVHWIAAVAFLFGGVACYEIVLLGNGIISTLWVPFLFAGIVYVVFIVHGTGIPSEKKSARAMTEWSNAGNGDGEAAGTPSAGTREDEQGGSR